MSKSCCFQLLRCEDLMLFFATHDGELNLFGSLCLVGMKIVTSIVLEKVIIRLIDNKIV